jgi:hypothetical protein
MKGVRKCCIHNVIRFQRKRVSVLFSALINLLSNLYYVSIIYKNYISMYLLFFHNIQCLFFVWGSGGLAPRIFNFGTRWKGIVGFTIRPL